MQNRRKANKDIIKPGRLYVLSKRVSTTYEKYSKQDTARKTLISALRSDKRQ